MLKDGVNDNIHSDPDRTSDAGNVVDEGSPLTCDDFFNRHPRYKKVLYGLPGVREVFDFVISRTEEMVRASVEDDRPALCGLLPAIESFHDPDSGLDFESSIFIRQFIGAVVGEIMTRRGFVRIGSRNISSGLAEFFKAGAIYKPMKNLVASGNKFKESRYSFPDFKLQKKKALEFAEEEGLKIKIMAAVTPGPDMMVFENRFDRLSSAGSPSPLKPASGRVDIFYETRGLRSVFLSAAQIAIELECRYPGIIAASGLKFSDDRYSKWPGGGKRFYFFVDLVERLLENLTAEGYCERRSLADWFLPAFICSYNYKDFVLNAAGGEILIYRAAAAPSGRRAERQPGLISPEGRFYSTFLEYYLTTMKTSGREAGSMDERSRVGFAAARDGFIREINCCIINSLKNAAADAAKKGTACMVSSCQLAIAAAEMQSGPGAVFSLKMIEDEFFGRLLDATQGIGFGESIDHAGLSLRHINAFTFSYSPDFENAIEAPGRFMPLAAINAGLCTKDDRGR